MKITKTTILIFLACSIALGSCVSRPAPADDSEPQPVPSETPTKTLPTETLVPSATATKILPSDTPIPSETATEALSTVTATREPRKTVIVKIFNDIQYGATQNHLLDVYQPQLEEQTLPTLVLFHGSGEGKFYMSDTAEYFARQGYAVVTFNRSLGNFPSSEQDSFCALAWVHAQADTYGFDTQRVVPVGFSLGGALAAFLGTVDDPNKYMVDCPHKLPQGDYFRAVITVAGFFDYAIWIPEAQEDGLIYSYFGPPNEHIQEIQEASPVTWVDGSEPPFLLIHGENDGVVDPAQSEFFAALLSEAGVTNQLLLQPNLTHESITTSAQSLSAIKLYLAELYSE